MNNMQVLESLSKILDKIHFAMDEVEDVVDNEIPKMKAESYLLSAEISVMELMDQLDNDAYTSGSKSGAV